MAEAYDAAIRNRLGLINDIGAGATAAAQQRFAMPQGGAEVSAGAAMSSGGGYSGPEGNGYKGPRGNKDALLNFGHWLQSQGYDVGENSMFNGGHHISGGHVKNSKHYLDRAIDVNHGAGTSKAEQAALAKIVGLAKLYGLHSIFMQPDHYNHAHFDF